MSFVKEGGSYARTIQSFGNEEVEKSVSSTKVKDLTLMKMQLIRK
jgi:hypothetical protein